MKKRDREIHSVTIDPDVWAWIEAAAKKQGVSCSQYVEGALLWDQCEDGNPEAIKRAFQIIRGKLRKRLEAQGLLGELKLPA